MLDPGNYNITLDTKIKSYGLVLSIDANKKYYIKNEYSVNWGNIIKASLIFFADPTKNFVVLFKEVPEKAGKEEIKSCKYVTFDFK